MNPLLTLNINLPEGFRLSSIQAFYDGNWIVCVCTQKPGEWIGEDYGCGYALDVHTAALRAIATAEANRELRAQGRTPAGKLIRHGSQAPKQVPSPLGDIDLDL